MSGSKKDLRERSPAVATMGKLGAEEISEKRTVGAWWKPGYVITGEVRDQAKPAIDIEGEGTGASMLVKVFFARRRADIETAEGVPAEYFSSGCVLALTGRI